MTIHPNTNISDELLATMAASGFLKDAPASTRASDAEIDDLDTQLDEIVEPQGAALIEKVAELAPVEEIHEGDTLAEDDILDELLLDDAETAAEEDTEVHPSLLEGLEEQLAGQITTTVAADEEIDLDTLETALAAKAARMEVYAEQESKVGLVELPTVKIVPAAAKTPKAPKAPRVHGTARAARFGAADAGSYVASVASDTALESAVNALPKKVKEKAANLVDFLHKGRPLSVFTRVAVDIMKSEGKISNNRLVQAFTTEATKRGMAAGYSIGTARSQAGQQIALFGRLGIANNAGGALVPNTDSPIWQKLAA